jgi:hypothetical protein
MRYSWHGILRLVGVISAAVCTASPLTGPLVITIIIFTLLGALASLVEAVEVGLMAAT